MKERERFTPYRQQEESRVRQKLSTLRRNIGTTPLTRKKVTV